MPLEFKISKCIFSLMTKTVDPIGDVGTSWQPSETFGMLCCKTVFDVLCVNNCYYWRNTVVPFRGKCPIRQYILSKPDRYGINVWAACDTESSYFWNAEAYLGCRDGEPKELQLTQDLKGRNITCDNFLWSLPLAKELELRKQTIVETVQKNQTVVPVEFSSAKGRIFNSTLEGYHDNNDLILYSPEKGKSVVLLSTMHDSVTYHRKDKKPNITELYNSTKGGVDNPDKLVATYRSKCQTEMANGFAWHYNRHLCL